MKKMNSCSPYYIWVRLIEVFTLLIVVTGFVIPAVLYSGLPNEIPVHFDLNGDPDSYRPKALIWILPAASLLLYLFTTGLAYLPKLLNRRAPVINDKVERLYRRVKLMFSLVKLTGAAILTFITVEILFNPQRLLASLLTIVALLLALMALLLIFYVYRRLKTPLSQS